MVMTTDTPHLVKGHVGIVIMIHRQLYGTDPAHVLVGLMDMVSLERGYGPRPADGPLLVDGVPVMVGGLEATARCVA